MKVLLGGLVSRRVHMYLDDTVLAGSQTLLFGLGEWILVTAAAGGVGMSAVQIAKGMHRFPRASTNPRRSDRSISPGCKGDRCCRLTSQARCS